MPTLCKANPLEQLIGACACAFGAAKLQRNLDVLPGRERRYQLEALEHEADLLAAELGPRVLTHLAEIVAVEDHLAASRGIESGEESEKRGLPAARGSDDCDEPTLRNGERDVPQNGKLLIAAAVFPCNFTCNEHEIPDGWNAGRFGRVQPGAKYGQKRHRIARRP